MKERNRVCIICFSDSVSFALSNATKIPVVHVRSG